MKANTSAAGSMMYFLVGLITYTRRYVAIRIKRVSSIFFMSWFRSQKDATFCLSFIGGTNEKYRIILIYFLGRV